MRHFIYERGDEQSHKEFGRKLQELKDGKYVVEIKRLKAIRSISHNRYYWAILNIISISTGEYDRERLHKICAKKFNCEIVNLPKGGAEIIAKETKNLDSSEFHAYVSRVKAWARDEFGIIIPEKDQITQDRMMDIENNYEETFQG